MRTLLIGDMKRIERFYHWLDLSTECFEVELIISENELTSKYYNCPVKAISLLGSINTDYDAVFICSSLYQDIKKILLMLGIPPKNILSETDICKYLSKDNIMNYYSENICLHSQFNYTHMGDFTYGDSTTTIWNFDKGNVELTIGKFCSIAPGVDILLGGGGHRSDWCTTYPFSAMMKEFEYIEKPGAKGNIVIGNDVWIGMDSKILSGVHIGNGSIIAAGAIVTKDVEPYSIAGGIPAKTIRKRFDDKTIQKLEEIQWWNWSNEQIYDAIPILQSNRLDQLFEYYDTIVCPHR